MPVRRVLIDPAADIRNEIYLGIVIDRVSRRAVMMTSAAGGMDIEEVAATTPEKIVRVPIDPFVGMTDHLARDVAVQIGLPRELWPDFVAIAKGLAAAFAANDASLAEINPLAIVETPQRRRLYRRWTAKWSSTTTPCSATPTWSPCATRTRIPRRRNGRARPT